MGAEATCSARTGRKTATGKALLETKELIFRSPDFRLVIPFADISAVKDAGGKLSLTYPEGTAVFDAEAPLAEVLRYATDLRSITQGRGSFEMEFDHYAEVPAHMASKIVAEAQKAREAVHA